MGRVNGVGGVRAGGVGCGGDAHVRAVLVCCAFVAVVKGCGGPGRPSGPSGRVHSKHFIGFSSGKV